MELSNITAVVGLALLAVIFSFMVIPLKDKNLLSRYPCFNSRVFRFLLVVLFTIQLAEIVDPKNLLAYLWLFDFTLLCLGLYFLRTYNRWR